MADYLFLGRELPSRNSWFSLLGLLVGAAGYVATDSSFQVHGYFWVCVWYFVFCFDQVPPPQTVRLAAQRASARPHPGASEPAFPATSLPHDPKCCVPPPPPLPLQIYIKHAVDTVKMDSNWGRVFYTNLLSCLPLIAHGSWDSTDYPEASEFTTGCVASLLTGVCCCVPSWVPTRLEQLFTAPGRLFACIQHLLCG